MRDEVLAQIAAKHSLTANKALQFGDFAAIYTILILLNILDTLNTDPETNLTSILSVSNAIAQQVSSLQSF
ncbi:putative membrane protein [Propionispora sp. 2/2-37]|uniref:hypothetical protein n=1 Tax=Propionispora sp. 2/2-37 TaxID=1677858 RepID=UPI0006BB61B3|nr:hypothetical protein [Propionispora sp. 2/2-37]CUH95660.1 putative membrane protein [Propionispora sp. 2/2-37]